MSIPGEELLSIRRELVTFDHQALRKHIPDINHELPHLQIKWRRLGKAGLTVVERGEYQQLAEKPNGKLGKANAVNLAKTINESIIPKMPTEGSDLAPAVTGVDFLGDGRYLSIAYLLDPSQLTPERKRFSKLLDKMNGLNAYWKEFKPHVSVATIDAQNAEQAVLDAFHAIAPPNLRLLLATADAT